MYTQVRIYIMDLQVAKWGNSLALRIPSEIVRRLGLREGATVEAQLTVDGSLSIRPAQWNRKAFALELTEARSAMPMSDPVMEELRGGARY
jgi:antitoxin MazE